MSDAHDIISMKLFELDGPENAQANLEDRSKIEPSSTVFEPPRDHVEDPKSSSMSGMYGLLGAITSLSFNVLDTLVSLSRSKTNYFPFFNQQV